VYSDEGRRILKEATKSSPRLEMVMLVSLPVFGSSDWVVDATVRDLDGMYSLVESLRDRARGEKRQEVLEELLAGLSAAMDGF
jgi:hypothetical protein